MMKKRKREESHFSSVPRYTASRKKAKPSYSPLWDSMSPYTCAWRLWEALLGPSGARG